LLEVTAPGAGPGIMSNVHFCTFQGNQISACRLSSSCVVGGIAVVSESPLILVVEDEYALQGVLEDALAEAGFETDILSSAEEALTLFKGGSKNYKALVTDVSLKGRLSGWDVARQIRAADPAFPVVYMTGAAADQWASQGVPNSILLQKPFAPAQLVTAISQLLNIGSAPSAPA